MSSDFLDIVLLQRQMDKLPKAKTDPARRLKVFKVSPCCQKEMEIFAGKITCSNCKENV